jgi:hypothetical protein
MFKHPFYVSPHAVKRFRERVARLPAKTIRTVIQAALQDNKQTVGVQWFNRQRCPVFRARYLNIDYLIPVLKEGRKRQDTWPVVPTILLPGMTTNEYTERSGWPWRY